MLRHRVLGLSVLASLKSAELGPANLSRAVATRSFLVRFSLPLYTVSLRNPKCLGRALTTEILELEQRLENF